MVATRSKFEVIDLASRGSRGTGPGSGNGGGGTGPSGPGPRPSQPMQPVGVTDYGRRIAEGARRPTPELLARLARILRTPAAIEESTAAPAATDLPKAA